MYRIKTHFLPNSLESLDGQGDLNICNACHNKDLEWIKQKCVSHVKNIMPGKTKMSPEIFYDPIHHETIVEDCEPN